MSSFLWGLSQKVSTFISNIMAETLTIGMIQVLLNRKAKGRESEG